jgi:hypothetical protein
MPNPLTFQIPPIREIVERHVEKAKLTVDPFARDCDIASVTNDLNPETRAQYHMTAAQFLAMLKERGDRPDLVLFDPPYSPRQIKECYDGIGLKMAKLDAFTTGWFKEKKLIAQMMAPGGFVIYCGWNTIGMTESLGYEIVEGLIVCHGPGHNDTLVSVWRKLNHNIQDWVQPRTGTSEVPT